MPDILPSERPFQVNPWQPAVPAVLFPLHAARHASAVLTLPMLLSVCTARSTPDTNPLHSPAGGIGGDGGTGGGGGGFGDGGGRGGDGGLGGGGDGGDGGGGSGGGGGGGGVGGDGPGGDGPKKA